MNYRHAFHAGNFADVHKHVVLLALLAHLHRKPKPILYLDTHAGRGRYDLRSAEAARGREWQTGIGRLAGAAPLSPDIRRYLQAISSSDDISSGKQPASYPGSPLIALTALREHDRAVLVERQIAEARALEHLVEGRRRVSVLCDDGYAALKAHLPPKENRGLVLIDPPYEASDEFLQAERALQSAIARFRTGVFALWYPLKAGLDAERLRRNLAQSGFRKLLLLELCIRPPDSPLGLNGSGLVVANPPWQFDTDMVATTDELHRHLSPDGMGSNRVEWLVPE
jgi:23S rRNA (adenine2030-N6)-methyltransferase